MLADPFLGNDSTVGGSADADHRLCDALSAQKSVKTLLKYFWGPTFSVNRVAIVTSHIHTVQ